MSRGRLSLAFTLVAAFALAGGAHAALAAGTAVLRPTTGGTYAFTFAPLWAKTLADLVTGLPRLPVDITGLEPDRLVTSRANLAGEAHG